VLHIYCAYWSCHIVLGIYVMSGHIHVIFLFINKLSYFSPKIRLFGNTRMSCVLCNNLKVKLILSWVKYVVAILLHAAEMDNCFASYPSYAFTKQSHTVSIQYQFVVDGIHSCQSIIYPWQLSLINFFVVETKLVPTMWGFPKSWLYMGTESALSSSIYITYSLGIQFALLSW